ncbi:IscS subfamily cysteine desulfurase [Bacillus sp. 165]|uniref:IscS subfamily cysteine desulfurase n=1 Tax=Bacillus sp. 165 TaxID=1529117 RepID=UPI001AD9BDF0|nr:IscS subfamily cysteine desulfurase [Bacillus sp. 165]MBO9130492.1 IscS subfamily cysteine desulfurase [Bacillus sp. 165]
MIYLDYAATTPMSNEALQTYSEAAKHYFGNEQSLHDIGSTASSLLQTCKKAFAGMINGRQEGVYFTSGGSESNILALHSLLTAHKEKGNHIITTSFEHASIRNYFAELETQGFRITYLPVDCYGLLDCSELERAITDQTILASIQHGNSEIGTVQNLQKIGAILKEHNIIFHSDCVQTFGKISIDVQNMHIDSLSVSSHKLYGPKGVGACYISPNVKWKPAIEGTTHEGGFRPGTVNIPGIASFLTAAQHMMQSMDTEALRIKQLRRMLSEGLESLQHPIELVGHPEQCLPYIAGIIIKGIEGQYTMLECNRNGIAISTGSACQIGKQAPSKTMLAIGKSAEEAKQYVRLSFGKYTTEQDIQKVLTILQTMIVEYFKGVVNYE